MRTSFLHVAAFSTEMGPHLDTTPHDPISMADSHALDDFVPTAMAVEWGGGPSTNDTKPRLRMEYPASCSLLCAHAGGTA
jgi:hypothetical protein